MRTAVLGRLEVAQCLRRVGPQQPLDLTCRFGRQRLGDHRGLRFFFAALPVARRASLSASLQRRVRDWRVQYGADREVYFLAPGTYTGVPINDGDVPFSVDYAGGPYGGYGPDFFQIDTRIGYRARWASRQTLDLFFEVFNLTNRANFDPPSGDQKSANFLLLRSLWAGSGFPRQVQLGMRYGF